MADLADGNDNSSFFDDAVSSVKSFFGLDTPAAPSVTSDLNNTKTWTVNPQNWYQVFPYSFDIVVKNDGSSDLSNSDFNGPDGSGLGGAFTNTGFKLANNISGVDVTTTALTYTLPIPPQSLQVSMVPATKVTATVGGVVEETSANVFWLIQMSGTTGTAVGRDAQSLLGGFGTLFGGSAPTNDFMSVNRSKQATVFRDKIQTTGLLSGISANLQQVATKVGGVVDSLISTGSDLANGNFTAAAGDVTGALTSAFLPSLPYGSSAVSGTSNGFSESQALMQFFYTYAALKDKHPQAVSLRFTSYKTSQQWDCSLASPPTLQQSAQNPHLYRYQLALKCWNVQDPMDPSRGEAVDRFGPGGDLQAVNTLGLANTIKFGTSAISALKSSL